MTVDRDPGCYTCPIPKPLHAARLCRPVLLTLALCLLTGLARAGQTEERWYIVEMMGSRSGWMRSTQTTTDTTITTDTELKLEIKRGPAEINISMAGSFVETIDGKPVSMSSTQTMASIPVSQRYTFLEDGSIEHTSEQNGAVKTVTVPKPEGVWLTPAAAERYVLQRMKSGAEEITVRSMDPSTGPKPFSSTRSGFEKASITALGKPVQATKIMVKNSIVPTVKSIEYIDDDGELVRSETNLGGLALTMVAATKEEALAKGAAGPELMVSTLVKPDKPIASPRQATRAVLRLSVAEGELPPLPNTGAQVVEAEGPSSSLVTITTGQPAPAPEKDSTHTGYLGSTTMADLQDENIRALAARSVAKAADNSAAKAEAVRQFVHRFIRQKDLGVGFATASETALTRSGDCSEHGVLLTALLRANGIPARVATGLLYVDSFAGAEEVFGYHMWAQALLTIDGKPRWVDLDATLPKDTPFDATHVTLATSDLEDGVGAMDLASIAPLLGTLRIEVVEVE
jgi:hypothetical protein